MKDPKKLYHDNLLFIGDVHGSWDVLFKTIRKELKRNPNLSIYQLGDMGIGFMHYHKFHKEWRPDKDRVWDPRCKFIRGNHDNPDVCRNHPCYLGEYGYIPEHKLAFISGAKSTDREHRTEGRDWWTTEELSVTQADQAIEMIDFTKPEIIMTHSAPRSIADTIGNYQDTSFTGSLLEFIHRHVHQPKLWVFGHYHTSFDRVIDNTRFVCIEQLHL